MSNKREPLLSDKDITTAAAIQGDASMAINDNDFAAGERARGYTSGAVDAKDLYEAARAKDEELIQRLVNALDETKDAFELYASCQCDGTGCPICRVMDRADNALFSANEHGFKPTNR